MKDRMRGWALSLQRVLLGLWAGSVAGFSFGVAPTLFRVIRAAPADRVSAAPNALAGDVVVPVLQSLASFGLLAGFVCMALLWANPHAPRLGWRFAAMAVGVLGVVVSKVWLMPTMLDLLAQMNAPVDALAVTHPLRVAFDGLHQYSAAVHSLMFLGPLVALALEKASVPDEVR